MLKFNLFPKACLVIAIFSLAIFSHADTINNEVNYIPLNHARWKVRPNIKYVMTSEECLSTGSLEVIARLEINDTGKLTNISLLKKSGSRHFDKKMLKQLKTAEFYPYIINGNPAKGTIILPIKVTC